MTLGIRGEVYRLEIDANGVPGPVTLLDESLDFPNGIAVHPDGGRLYVAVSRDNAILAYDLQRRRRFEAGGSYSSSTARPWTALRLTNTPGSGSLASRTAPLTCWTSTVGELLASYAMGGTDVTNLCWWDTSLYVTVRERHSIERLDLGIRGARIIPT